MLDGMGQEEREGKWCGRDYSNQNSLWSNRVMTSSSNNKPTLIIYSGLITGLQLPQTSPLSYKSLCCIYEYHSVHIIFFFSPICPLPLSSTIWWYALLPHIFCNWPWIRRWKAYRLWKYALRLVLYMPCFKSASRTWFWEMQRVFLGTLT
jgi:hypothetical protein